MGVSHTKMLILNFKGDMSLHFFLISCYIWHLHLVSTVLQQQKTVSVTLLVTMHMVG